MHDQTAEHQRLVETRSGTADWKHWGPYLSERAWGTVREDYSANGDAWNYFPHDHARSRAYRWNEDGLAGISDSQQFLCCALALWNTHDPILKERIFGLTGPEGNHGEDVKDYYFYLDSTPTHSYMKQLYKYPQVAFPYDNLVAENGRRGYNDLEYELFNALEDDWRANRYFDVVVEYAKADAEDILCRITITNRGSDPAPVHVLPHCWYRNVWSWNEGGIAPRLRETAPGTVELTHPELGKRWWYVQPDGDTTPPLLFTENNTNTDRLFGYPNGSSYVKDSINDTVVHGAEDRINPAQEGSKVAAHYHTTVAPGASYVVYTRLTDQASSDPFANAAAVFAQRIAEADAFYATFHGDKLTDDEKLVQRQAFAGMLWTKQFYYYDVDRWLKGDPGQPAPERTDAFSRNTTWQHMYAADILSMPDKWEYPWFAAWDLAFHCLPLAMVDPDFAKQQLLLLGAARYLHPNGRVPAYEWNFNDVNPPVIAWAVMRVYQIERELYGTGDLNFLERAFHKLVLNFTWWINREDPDGNNVFGGGFLGLDNIGIFDRSAPLPIAGHLEQSDGTSWMAMFTMNMIQIAAELAYHNPTYTDIAYKFFEHFFYIADAMNRIGGDTDLWDDEDGFYYDVLHTDSGERIPLKVRSMVGLIPLYATFTITYKHMEQLPLISEWLNRLYTRRPQLARLISACTEPGRGANQLLAVVRGQRLRQILLRLLDETEFLSEYGVRALSAYHRDNPYTFMVGQNYYEVRYLPAESDSGLFGGNSNWRGPIWFPVNYLILESLEMFAQYYEDDYRVECPVGSGTFLTLDATAHELMHRLVHIFVCDPQKDGRRAVFGGNDYFQHDPHWRDCIPFYEYFHGDNGAGVGASHQTGWTGLVALLLYRIGHSDAIRDTE